MDRRLAASIGFLARADAIDELLAGTDPVDADGARRGRGGREGHLRPRDRAVRRRVRRLADPGDPRRCAYLASVVTQLARTRPPRCSTDWTDGYRDTFVAGMDGDPQSSVDAIVNEVIFRVTETDDQGLRSLVEATALDELPANRADGPAAFHAAELRGDRSPGRPRCWATTSTTAACSRSSPAGPRDTADRLAGGRGGRRPRRWPPSPTR